VCVSVCVCDVLSFVSDRCECWCKSFVEMSDYREESIIPQVDRGNRGRGMETKEEQQYSKTSTVRSHWRGGS
jgi:hypothetical protein